MKSEPETPAHRKARVKAHAAGNHDLCFSSGTSKCDEALRNELRHDQLAALISCKELLEAAGIDPGDAFDQSVLDGFTGRVGALDRLRGKRLTRRFIDLGLKPDTSWPGLPDSDENNPDVRIY